METSVRATCRICTGSLIPLLELGDLAINDFPETHEQCSRVPRTALTLTVCDKCGLAQLDRTVSPDLLYRNYWYRSGVNEMMVKELERVVWEATRRVPAADGLVVLDIGANDGTLLSHYRALFPTTEIDRIAIDPAHNLQPELAEHAEHTIVDYFPSEALTRYEGQIGIITAIAMCYDLEDPLRFFAYIRRLLRVDGVAIVQFQDMGQMLETAAFDNICFPKGTLVLGDNKPIEAYTQGDQVFGESGRLTPVRRGFSREYAGPLTTIKAKFTVPLVTTPNHPVKVVPRDQVYFPRGQRRPILDLTPTWKEAGAIRRGDHLVIPRIRPRATPPVLDLSAFNATPPHPGLWRLPFTEETAWLLGLYTAEGNYSLSGPTFTLNETETAIVGRITEIASTVHRATCTVPRRKYGQAAVSAVISCRALGRAFKAWCGPRARLKRIPDFVMTAPDSLRRAFLRGLIAGDGNVRGNKIQFRTSSYTLAVQVQLLAAALGGVMGIAETPPTESRKRDGQRIRTGRSWHVRGSSPTLCEIFAQPYTAGRRATNPSYIVQRDAILVPVTRVSETPYQGTVYNMETGDHTYVVSNVVTHNCHEHLEYYTLHSLRRIIRQAGLALEGVSQTPINGGSLRVALRRADFFDVEGTSVTQQLLRERAQGLDTPTLASGDLRAYQGFARRVQRVQAQITQVLEAAHQSAATVDVYGASTKGNILLQVLGVGPERIRQAIDRSSAKHGHYTITGIPIVGEAQAREDPAQLWLIPIWQFRSSVLKREQWYLERGGRMIFPLPAVEIVAADWLSPVRIE